MLDTRSPTPHNQLVPAVRGAINIWFHGLEQDPDIVTADLNGAWSWDLDLSGECPLGEFRRCQPEGVFYSCCTSSQRMNFSCGQRTQLDTIVTGKACRKECKSKSNYRRDSRITGRTFESQSQSSPIDLGMGPCQSSARKSRILTSTDA